METLEQDTVTITTEEYTRLEDAAAFLEALRAQGVDNWDGYDEACREFYGDED